MLISHILDRSDSRQAHSNEKSEHPRTSVNVLTSHNSGIELTVPPGHEPREQGIQRSKRCTVRWAIVRYRVQTEYMAALANTTYRQIKTPSCKSTLLPIIILV